MAFTNLEQNRLELEARFWPKVDKAGDDDCWLWTAAKNRKGYGVIGVRVPRSIALATHVSMMLAERPKPRPDAIVCHRCDNPSCVNPRHLWWGDVSENNRDMHTKGRWDREKPKGEKNWAHKLNEEQVKRILASSENNSATGRRYGVTTTLIWKIRNGKLWTHLPRN